MRLRYSRRALAQIDEVANYIVKDDPSAAAAFYARVEWIAALLTHYPSMGRRTDLADIRTVSLRPYPYRLFYKISEGTGEIRVLRIAMCGAPNSRVWPV